MGLSDEQIKTLKSRVETAKSHGYEKRKKCASKKRAKDEDGTVSTTAATITNDAFESDNNAGTTSNSVAAAAKSARKTTKKPLCAWDGRRKCTLEAAEDEEYCAKSHLCKGGKPGCTKGKSTKKEFCETCTKEEYEYMEVADQDGSRHDEPKLVFKESTASGTRAKPLAAAAESSRKTSKKGSKKKKIKRGTQQSFNTEKQTGMTANPLFVGQTIAERKAMFKQQPDASA